MHREIGSHWRGAMHPDPRRHPLTRLGFATDHDVVFRVDDRDAHGGFLAQGRLDIPSRRGNPVTGPARSLNSLLGPRLLHGLGPASENVRVESAVLEITQQRMHFLPGAKRVKGVRLSR
jgi:hypothetical protein